jgi:hypothetical protein
MGLCQNAVISMPYQEVFGGSLITQAVVVVGLHIFVIVMESSTKANRRIHEIEAGSGFYCHSLHFIHFLPISQHLC